MNVAADLVEVLRWCRDRQATLGEALTHARNEGIPPEQLLEHAAPADVSALHEEGPVWWFDDADADWVRALVGFAGGVREAQALLDRTRRWRGFDVSDHLVHLDGIGAVHEAMARGGSVDEIATLTRAAGGRLDHVLREVARRWPLADVVTSRHIEPAVLREELPSRGSWPDLADALLGSLADGVVVAALQRILRLPEAPGTRGRPRDPAYAAVALRVALQRRARRPLWELRAFAASRLSLPRWLGLFRTAGFSPALAALAALEEEPDPRSAVEVLRAANYRDDEILAGIAACGVGPEEALAAVAWLGWEPHRIVVALRSGGWLDAEIREHLRALGLPRARVSALLTTALDLSGA